MAGIGLEGLNRRALTTQAQFISMDCMPPVYTENGTIIMESEQMEKSKLYRVILGNIRYIVVKNQEGDVDIYDHPPA